MPTSPYQVFDARLNYGALGNGIADDTTALQNWLTDASNAYSAPTTPGNPFAGKSSGVAYLPAGRYLVKKPLTITNAMTLRVVGEGNASVIVYDPDPNNFPIPPSTDPDPAHYPVFELQQCWACRFQDFAVVCKGDDTTRPTRAVAAFRQSNVKNPSGFAINSVCEWHNIWVGGAGQPGFGGTFTYGWEIFTQALLGPDTNNEEHQWHSCRVDSYNQAAFHLYGFNVLGCRFHNCNLVGGNRAPFGVYCQYAGHLYWYGGFGGAHTSVDFYIEGALKQAVIECRWEGNPTDGQFIVFRTVGPLVVEGNVFTVPIVGNNAVLHVVFAPSYQTNPSPPLPSPLPPGASATNGSLIHQGNSYLLQVTPTASAVLVIPPGTGTTPIQVRDSRTNNYRKLEVSGGHVTGQSNDVYCFGNAD